MGFIRNSLIGLRNDPKFLLRLPPYLSLLCVFVGLLWLLILPLDQYSRRSYISENALLPGQVNIYFGGSEHNIFRAYRHEVAALYDGPEESISQKLGDIFESQGLKVGQQKYRYESGGKTISGQNVYAVLQGPRADATEALVLLAALHNMDNVPNQSGVALLLTLARYFNRWSLWSKDVIFIVTGDSIAGPQAWVDAYHSTHNPALVDDLSIKSGALQAAVALDYPAGTGGHRFEKIHVVYDGVNGQLPNLDLFNTVVQIASNHIGIRCAIQRMWDHTDTYNDRLRTVLRGLLTQGLGHASGPHSSFIPYHVDAITLQTVGDGWHDEMTLGRLVESTFRSLNNLLEHLHQSFFLYILMQAQRFVSIGTYLPSAMLIAVSFSIMSIALWVQSGRVSPSQVADPYHPSANRPGKAGTEVLEKDGVVVVVPKALNDPSKRKVFFAMIVVLGSHLLGLLPLYSFNNLSESAFRLTFLIVISLSNAAPYLTAYILQRQYRPSSHTLALISCISLLILGIALSTLSTLNFSLGLMTGLFASPLSFVVPITVPNPTLSTARISDPPSSFTNSQMQKLVRALYMLLLHIASPPMVILVFSSVYNRQNSSTNSFEDALVGVLSAAAQAWHISGTWTSVVVWLVWWPAWFASVTVAAYGLCWSPHDSDAQENAKSDGKSGPSTPSTQSKGPVQGAESRKR